MEKPPISFEKLTRRTLYAHIRAGTEEGPYTEKTINDSWRNFILESDSEDPDKAKVNAEIIRVRKEYEADRRKMVEEFHWITIFGIFKWALTYNHREFDAASTLGKRLADYFLQSTQTVVFPLAVDENERFPGCVQFEAIKVYSKFSQMLLWAQTDVDRQQQMRQIDSIQDLFALSRIEDFWEKPNILPTETQAAAD